MTFTRWSRFTFRVSWISFRCGNCGARDCTRKRFEGWRKVPGVNIDLHAGLACPWSLEMKCFRRDINAAYALRRDVHAGMPCLIAKFFVDSYARCLSGFAGGLIRVNVDVYSLVFDAAWILLLYYIRNKLDRRRFTSARAFTFTRKGWLYRSSISHSVKTFKFSMSCVNWYIAIYRYSLAWRAMSHRNLWYILYDSAR